MSAKFDKGESRQKWRETDIIADPAGFMCGLSGKDRDYILNRLSEPHRREINERWPVWAHEGQNPDDGDWRVWMIMAGRGFGKTRAGSEWVSRLARADGSLRFALIGATMDDVRKVMIEGESGIINVKRATESVDWNATRGEVRFASGAVAHIYSAESYEKLRGPEHHHAWCDELAKWNNAEACWNNMMLGLRLGEKPRVLVTTTPKTIALLRKLIAQDGVVRRGGKTKENLNLPDAFIESVQATYAGTRWGRQELDGELIDDVAGALWSRDLLERQRVTLAPPLTRVVIGVDPPVSEHGDHCGIIAVGVGTDDKAYVLADHSIAGASPEGWARAVAAAAERWQADRVVAEVNQGGNMVESVLRAADISMPVKRVHASRGKSARAEPVAALYETGRVFHVQAFPDLEDQMCGLIAGGDYEGPGRSPDRADALVWALTELMLGKAPRTPRVRML